MAYPRLMPSSRRTSASGERPKPNGINASGSGAGPASNFALALFGSALAWGGVFLAGSFVSLANGLYLVGGTLALTNLVLMFFNLIPIPPLDGSSIVPLFLPDSAMHGWYRLQRYSFPILIGILWLLPAALSYVGIDFSPIGAYFDHTVIPVWQFLMPR